MFEKLLKFLASLKLAVVIILGLGIISAAGTIIESRFNDARMAQTLVYQSWYMWTTLILLAINLTAVMVDRWPWRIHHSGFVLAHVGILFLLLGSAITYFYGIDGSMRFPVGGVNSYITVPETDVVVYASMDGDKFTKIFEKEVQFLKSPPVEENPFIIPLPGADIKILDYIPYALMENKIVPVTGKGGGGEGAAIRFQLSNSNVNLTKWALQRSRKKEVSLNLGPAVVTLADRDVRAQKKSNKNEIVIYPDKSINRLRYTIYSKRKGLKTKKGVIRPGVVVETGWMGLQLRILKYYPSAKEKVSARVFPQSGELTSPAVKVGFKGKEYWMAMNSILRLFHDDSAYIFFYQNRRLELDFKIRLKEFKVGRYQGTMRAASYQSLVEVIGQPEETLISMNEPLKFGGFTFYQASFENNEEGQPTASILSVNHDPGRFLKYLGSLLIVLGTILMFYFKKAIAEGWRNKKKAVSMRGLA